MCELVFSLQEFLKIVPGLVIFPLTLYLAWKKIGRNISCAFSFGGDNLSADRITSIVLTNHKDSPVTIFEINAVFENDISCLVERFEPPIVLKSLESLVVETKPYSKLTVGNDLYNPSFDVAKLQVYVTCANKMIECKMVSHPSMESYIKFKHLTRASKIVKNFGGLVYSEEKVKYAFAYQKNAEVKTAFITHSGFLNGNGDFYFTHIELCYMESKDKLNEFFKGLDELSHLKVLYIEDFQKNLF